ncbi:hypothetical protein SCYAM73S_06190 [Streptomyces cyaneofuscatus]
MVPGAERDTQRSVARVTPWASTAARTPSAMRSPSRLISRSMAKATGTSSTAMLETSPAILISRSGACSVPLEMSSSRPVVVPWANAAIANSTAMAAMPMSSRIRSEGRCTRAGSSGSSPETRSLRAASAEASVEPVRWPLVDAVAAAGASVRIASARAGAFGACSPAGSGALAARCPAGSGVRSARSSAASGALGGRSPASEASAAFGGCTPCSFVASGSSSWSRITGHRPDDGGTARRRRGASGCVARARDAQHTPLCTCAHAR